MDYIQLIEEIRKTNKLLSLIATASKNQTEKILLLNEAGFAVKDIGEWLGIPANTVSVTVYQDKKRTKKKHKMQNGKAKIKS